MAKNLMKAPVFDEIIFLDRNKEYGAYTLRKKYNRTVLIGIVLGAIILATAVITPYLKASADVNREVREERTVELQMQNLETPQDMVAPAAPPPPPPTETATAAIKYVAPVVVDSIKPDEVVTLMTVAQAEQTIVNEDVNLVEVVEVVAVQEEISEEEQLKEEPFIIVEEPASFPGGELALLAFVNENIKYPEIAKENNIQGRVILTFCVTFKGTVDRISVLKGVDPALDAEAMRVVSLLPAFNPGKQGGRPVNVWFSLPINFVLKQ